MTIPKFSFATREVEKSNDLCNNSDIHSWYHFNGIMLVNINEEAQAKSYASNFADGYERGKDNRINDARNNNGRDPTCPPNGSMTWCIGYKAGYNVGYMTRNAIEED